MGMSVRQLKEILEKFDDKTRVVVKVETQLGQDEDYEVVTSYENILHISDGGHNLTVLEIDMIIQ